MKRDLTHILAITFISILFILPYPMASFGQAQEAQEANTQAQQDTPSPASTSPFEGAKPGEKREISLSFDHMDIVPVLDEILGEILQLNYVIDPAIRGSISLRVKGSYSKKEFIELLNNILELNGLALTKSRHDLYKVVRKANSGRATGTVKGKIKRAVQPGDQITILQLKYLSAAQAVNAVRNFVSASAVILPETTTNSIILSDTIENQRKVAKLLSLLDIPPFKGIDWKIFPLEASDAKDVAADLEKIFKTPGLYSRPGLDQGGFFILPLESINSVLVATRWPGLLDVAEQWIKELDHSATQIGSQVHIYFVQNGNSKEIVDVLKQLYGGTSGKTKSGKSRVLVKRRKQAEVPENELMGEVEFIADEVNNAVIIKASNRDYQTVLKILKSIDIVPRQVLIEVLIAEIGLNKDTEYGIEWYIKQRGINIGGKDYQGDMALTNGKTLPVDTPLGTGIPGFTYGLFKNSGDLRMLLHAISSFTDINILSSPTILSVDNQESYIEVGDDVPTLTNTQTTSGGVTTQSIQYRNAGIILKVKPYINERGLVRLEVTQEVSSVTKESTEGITSPRFKTRKASTTLIAEDGQTIVIGGLMQTQTTKTRTGVPILKDLPILGYIFGQRTFTHQKTELLIAITPHVIHNREQADAITREFQDKVKELKTLFEKG